ncbi:MAG: hypothetical protein U9R05_08600 [Chloroflexota bacterium]|nr:hypothetical protein [Chloroflexota bacterium]
MVNIWDTAELPAEELASIFKQGAILRLPYLESRLLQAREQIRCFEEKHKTTLAALKYQGLPDNAGYELHEDFIEWEYWSDVAHKTSMAIENVSRILEKVEEPVVAY